MHYKCEGCGRVEMFWNSRDGVTPFIATSACCGKPSMHINFAADQYAPGHKPWKGQRVFVDQTREGYREVWRKNVERNWEHVPYALKDQFATKDEALEALASDYRPGQPTVRVSDGEGGYL